MKSHFRSFKYLTTLALICLIAAGCTWNKSFVDLKLEDAIRQSGYRPIATLEHFTSPGSIVLWPKDAPAQLCDWTSVFLDLPALEAIRVIELSKYAQRGLELRARKEAVVRALESFFVVESVVVGPVVEMRLAEQSVPEQVSLRCAQRMRDAFVGPSSRARYEDLRLAEGTLTAHVSYRLMPISPKISPVIEPIIPQIVTSFGNFEYRADTRTLAGQLVLGIDTEDLPASVQAQVATQAPAYRTAQEIPLDGLWIVTRWEDPLAPSGTRIPRNKSVEGTLRLAKESLDSYAGTLSFLIDGRESVIQSVKVTRVGEKIEVEGDVVEGKNWADDQITLRLRGTQEMVGRARSEGVPGYALVSLTRAGQ